MKKSRKPNNHGSMCTCHKCVGNGWYAAYVTYGDGQVIMTFMHVKLG